MRGTGTASLVAEKEVVVGLNNLATVLASQVERTAAVKVVNEVNAAGRQRASPGHALNNVLFAVATRETVGADALVAASIVNASCAVLANANSASIKFVLAADADVIGAAGAIETRSKVTALAVIHTRIADAAVGCSFAAFSVSARWTGTEEVAE